ncbi:UPF0149 family protein [Vibrio breoganii]|uniref:UPF0149 family protein n=1 Tax=Vibrio breoganii TaxID=553239 RepID=A0AAP8SVY2_9VIBR|nr:UPF0149 family protein [Vibrio breoganii]ANO33155.1 hypothetical protein A6E01_08010 [Vibrio breoganii]NMO73755.1 UPF0149 family protein [Vibrio breoganii]NMR70193.1 UPF0149 family protein [Vibrio breoganii]OCH75202.1 hypothetical protein A6D95_02425 [Vibrio breoganii]OED90102.1 hypothetical protein A1QE_17470 [Vibrio breoganii ZF-55]
MDLAQIIAQPELEDRLLPYHQTLGFITAMAAAPNVLDPAEWIAYLWGGEESAPFTDGEQLESYLESVINAWNAARPALFEGTWQWPVECDLSDKEIVTEATKEFCEGLLQGWQLAQDDWQTLMPQDSQDNALLGGVLLSISMLYDPETSLATLSEEGMNGLDQFAEIFNAMPAMLCGLTQRGASLAQEQ